MNDSHLPNLTLEQLLKAERSHIFEVRVKQSEVLRLAGNQRFKEHSSSSSETQLAEAIELYQRALYHAGFEESTYNFELTDAHRASVRAAKAPIHLNLARCMMKQCRYREAIQEARKAIAVTETGNEAEMDFAIKANWIAGKAFFELQEFDEAEKIFQGILADNGENEEAKGMMRKIKSEKVASDKKQKAAWGGKLGGPTDPKSANPAARPSFLFGEYFYHPLGATSISVMIILVVVVVAVAISWKSRLIAK